MLVLKGQGLKGNETICSQVRERRSSVNGRQWRKYLLLIFLTVTVYYCFHGSGKERR
jgi:hypothetical protein